MRNRRATIPRSAQGGFALLMVMFLASLMLITVMVAAPYVRTERQREKEEEMIWRGRQYVRGIKLYYRKTGKFPTSMDDLTKPKLGSLRFMRQAYKDPMNKKDGEWRLIYVGPTGQLIGSLKPAKTLQLSGLAGAGQALPGTPAAQLGAQSAGQAAGQTFGQAVGQIFGNSGAAAQSAPSNSANQPNTAGSANSGTE